LHTHCVQKVSRHFKLKHKEALSDFGNLWHRC